MLPQCVIPGWMCVSVTGLPLVLALFLMIPRLRPLIYRLTGPIALPSALIALIAQPGHFDTSVTYLLGVSAGFDQVGRVFLFFTAMMWFFAGVHATGYVKGPHKARFFACFLIAMTGNFGLTVANDAVAYYTLFALMSFSSYGLVVHSGDALAKRASLVYIVLVVIGEALVFPAAIMCAAGAESVLLPDIRAYLATSPQLPVVALLVLVGFSIKAGVLPLHVWLPLAHPAAPTPASAVLSGCMIKAGVLGWIRFLPLGEAALPTIGQGAAVVGVITIFWGLCIGLTQSNPKALLAYSSVSKMGVMLLLVGLTLYEPELWKTASVAMLVYACFHGINKGALFLGCSVTPSAKRGGAVYVGLAVLAASFAGFPLLAGAMAKFPLKYALKGSGLPWATVINTLLPLTAVLTAFVMARFVVLARPRGEQGGHKADRLQTAAWWGAILLLLAFPLVLSAFGIFDKASAAYSPKYWWGALWPVLLAGGISYAVIRLGYRAAFKIPMGDILGIYERMLSFIVRLVPTCIRNLITRETSAPQQLRITDESKENFWNFFTKGEIRLSTWINGGLIYLALLVAIILLLAS